MAPDTSSTATPSTTPERLFAEFPVPSYDDWRKAAEATLKGAPFEKKLITKTDEGIDLQPIYTQDHIASLPHLDTFPGFPPMVRGGTLLGARQHPWTVSQAFAYPTAAEFNAALQADLPRGQTAVNLILDRATLLGHDADTADATTVGQGGVSISSLTDLQTALASVDLSTTPIHLQARTTALPIMALLIALVRGQGIDLATLKGSIGMDPLGALAQEGTLPRPLDNLYDVMAVMTQWAAAHTPQMRVLTVHSAPYHDGGGHSVQEVAFALATGVEYLRALQQRGLTVDAAASQIGFSMAISSQFFMEIAKLRAARLLWSKIVAAFGGSAESQRMVIHGHTGRWNKTVYDPYVNMLRATAEAFAGVMGGCDSLHVAPFDEVIRSPDEFSRRIARNVHIVLREEAGLERVVDPAGGSWYIESLTDTFARQAWFLFQEVEKQGGMYAALQAGMPQQQIAEVAAKRAKALAHRQAVLVGTNMYANINEKPLEVPTMDTRHLQQQRTHELATHRQSADNAKRQAALDYLAQSDDVVEAAVAAAQAGATVGEIARAVRKNDTAPTTLTPIRIHRAAEPFEQLRAVTEVATQQHGQRPTVFLVNMGPLLQHKARADFARSFLEVGGFAVEYPAGFATVDAALQAINQSTAQLFVICSTDATYPELVPPLTAGIKAIKPTATVLLAGYPTDHIESFKAAGIDEFIHVRANCYAILRHLQKQIGLGV